MFMLKNLGFKVASVAILVLLNLSPAQADTKTVVVLKTLSNPTMNARAEVFLRDIQAASDQKGIDLNLIQLDMQNDAERGESLLTEVLKDESVDLLIPIATKATAVAWKFREQLKAEGADTFFFFVSDPVSMGIIDQVGGLSEIGRAHV